MDGTSLGLHDDFQSLIDNLGEVAVWTASEPGSFDYVSAGFEDIWGFPPEEVENDVGRLIESIHPEDREEIRSQIQQPPSEVTPMTYVNRVVQPDGTVRWVQTRQVPIRDSEGTLTEIVGVCTDVTEQKRREQELEALNHIVRHDIRNDMNVVLGWADLLEDHVDEEGREHLERIQSTGDHVVELTELARDYVAALPGSGDVNVEPTPLGRTVREEIDRQREFYPAATIELSGELPDTDVTANEMLSSVVRNLLNNAVQHNAAAEPRVVVAAEREGPDVILTVADDGPGIPDARKETVFGKGETGLDSDGTGIGLYLVESLVDGFGGDVWITDNEPTGSIVHVRLPIAQ